MRVLAALAAAMFVALGTGVGAQVRRDTGGPVAPGPLSPRATSRPGEIDELGLVSQRRMDDAIARAAAFLCRQIGADGICKDEYNYVNARYGGKTALCAYALLTAGVQPAHRQDAHAIDANEAALSRALAWLGHAKLHGTYAVSLRACAYAAINDKTLLPALQKDVAWLVSAQMPDGGHTYFVPGKDEGSESDNSNSQMALMAVSAARAHGVEAPAEFWKKAHRYWLDQQQLDGGWGYVSTGGAGKSYGSMTAAGLASLYAVLDQLHSADYIKATAATDPKPIASAIGWLAKNYRADENPGKDIQWYYYWLFAVQRVGLASGLRNLGDHDWYSNGAAELLASQTDDGSWSDGEATDTAMATLFLARGSGPVLVSKLQYDSKWNARPRDMANLTQWLGHTFERQMNWQIVGAGAPLKDFQDAPILYISGAGPIELSDAAIAKLRTYVQQGGMIFSEAAGNNGDFTADMQKIYGRMFPDYPLQRLSDDHPLYRIQYPHKELAGLSGVSNGVRLLAIHSGRELSLGLQLGPSKDNLPCFELAANLYILATDKGILRPRGVLPWPLERKFTPKAAIDIVRLRHKANWDPEPLAWQRQAILMGNRYGIKLNIREPIDITDLDARKCAIAVCTGTEELELSAKEAKAFGDFFAQGGTLIVDAAGGAKAFAASVQKQILPLVQGGVTSTLSLKLLQDGPAPLDKLTYRRDFALLVGPSSLPRISGVYRNEKLAVVFTPDDLTEALSACQAYGIRGLAPQCAHAVVTNLLARIADIAAPSPATKPAEK
jgi:hypothetical protein